MNAFKIARWVVAGLTQHQAASLCGVTIRQVQRWERGQSRTPLAALRLVRLIGGGDLGEVCSDWSGWRIVESEIITPEGTGFTAGEIRALPLKYALLATYQQKRRPVEAVAPRTQQRPCSRVA